MIDFKPGFLMLLMPSGCLSVYTPIALTGIRHDTTSRLRRADILSQLRFSRKRSTAAKIIKRTIQNCRC